VRAKSPSDPYQGDPIDGDALVGGPAVKDGTFAPNVATAHPQTSPAETMA
jgi:hypothetical protein